MNHTPELWSHEFETAANKALHVAGGLWIGGLEDVVFVESLLPSLRVEILEKKARDDTALAELE